MIKGTKDWFVSVMIYHDMLFLNPLGNHNNNLTDYVIDSWFEHDVV